jgi:crotonobetainyl-CoA:carnitine CoA-transferase CaiB-like acyl-CoA transferase
MAQRAAVVGAGRPAAGGRFECADGKLVTTRRIWPDHVGRMVHVLGAADLTALWDSHGVGVMSEYPELINAHLARWAATRASREAMREAQAAGWPVVVVNDPLLLLNDDHLCARGFWVTAPHPVAGSLTHAGAPWRVDGGGWALHRTAPTLGQDTDEILEHVLGIRSERVAELRRGGVVA